MKALEPGTILAEKFRIDGVLGRGGMGVVLAAHHLQLDQPVALKFLHEKERGDPALVARFFREGRACAKIRGEHVTRIFDVCNSVEHGPYLVMERLFGRDFWQILKERRRFLRTRWATHFPRSRSAPARAPQPSPSALHTAARCSPTPR
ncbi:MAG: hypothetical protein EXR75_15345 [Myxococcales bacterium]|nr:hypothetical protein [Myxococcales bacterium]